MRFFLAMLALVGCAGDGAVPAVDEEPAPVVEEFHTTPVTWATACHAVSATTCYHLSECSLDAPGRDAGSRDLDPTFDVEACVADLTAACCVGRDCSAPNCYEPGCAGQTDHTTGDALQCIFAVDAQTCAALESGATAGGCEWL